MKRPKLLIIRDPDYETELVEEAAEEIDTIVIDLGSRFNGPKRFTIDLDEDEQREWIDDTLFGIADLDADSPIRRRVEELVRELQGDAS